MLHPWNQIWYFFLSLAFLYIDIPGCALNHLNVSNLFYFSVRCPTLAGDFSVFGLVFLSWDEFR